MKPSTSLGTRSNVGMAKPSPPVRQAGNIGRLLVIHGVCRRSVPSRCPQVKYRCRCRDTCQEEWYHNVRQEHGGWTMRDIVFAMELRGRAAPVEGRDNTLSARTGGRGPHGETVVFESQVVLSGETFNETGSIDYSGY